MSCDLRIMISPSKRSTGCCRYTGDALVWIGVAGYASMIAYGFYKDFNIVMTGSRHSDCS
jgi:hypothetical protein